MGYYIDLKNISIDDYKEILRTADLLPSHMILTKNIDEMFKDSTQYEAKEAQILAIAYQTQNGAVKSVENTNAEFPILVDMDHAISDAYGAYSKGILLAVFIIDQNGKILWHDVAVSAQTDSRVPSQTILENLPDINE